MLAFAEPRAHDDGSDGRLLQYPASRDIGHRDRVLARDPRECSKNALEHLPAPDGVDETQVLHLAPIIDGRRSRRADPVIPEKSTAERAVTEQLDAVFPAERAHLAGGPGI